MARGSCFAAETAENVVPLPAVSKQAENTTPAAGVLLPQILASVQDLQKNMDLLLVSQESHYEDVEELGSSLQGLEETEGILHSIERNSNAVRAETDRIVGATNAAASAVWGVVQVVGIVGGIVSAVLFLYTTLQAAQKTSTAQSPAPLEEHQKSGQRPKQNGLRPME